jgi:PAS domain S-box-containing protein
MTAISAALAEVGEAIQANQPLDTVLSHIVNAMSKLVSSDRSTLALLDTTQQVMRIGAAVDRQGMPVVSLLGRTMALDLFITTQTIIGTRLPLYIPNTRNSPLWRDDEQDKFDIQGFLGLPLIVGNSVIGLLLLDFCQVDPLPDDVNQNILSFVQFAATAINNARQHVALRKTEERYRLAVGLTSDAVYEWRIGETNIAWSGDIDGLLQYPVGEFPRTEAAWIEAIHPNDRKRILVSREAMIFEGVRFEEEYRLTRSDGSYCYVLDRAIRCGTAPTAHILGVIADLTNTYELTDALVESEVRYRMLFAHALDAIFVTDETGLLLDFNPAAEALTGREYPQLTMTSLSELLPPNASSEYLTIFQLLKEKGEIGNFGMRFFKPDNTAVDVEMWGTALGGGMYQLVARDISMRQQTQVLAAQRIAELTALSDVTEATTTGGEVIDILKRVLPVAMGALEMPMGCIYLRKRPSAVLQLVAQHGLRADDSFFSQTLSLEDMESGRITPFSKSTRIKEYPLVEGQPAVSLQVPLIANNIVLGLMIFADTKSRAFLSTDIYLMDILGRQLSIGVENVRLFDNLEQLVNERTDELFSTQTRYKSLIEQVPGVVYTADTPHSGISFISGGTEDLFGIIPQDMMRIEDPLLSCIKPEDLPWVTEKSNRAATTGLDFDEQYRVSNIETRKDRWVHHRARLIIAGTGETFWLGLLTDVTNLKELDDLKSQFVATVSHELRTPLTAIKLRAGTLSNYYQRLTDDQRLEMVQRITYQADILAELIEDVLRLAKLDGGTVDRQIEEIDLIGSGSDVIDELKPNAENAGLQLEAVWPGHRCPVRADASDIARVWRNLVSNAIKYTPPPGHVKVYSGQVQLDNQGNILNSTIAPEHLILPDNIGAGSWMVGVVRDTGKGMSSYDQSHIFTRFYRGEAALTSIPGTGLGLSLVKELLDDYSGHIALRSALGKGSTFAFWLPTVKHSEESLN